MYSESSVSQDDYSSIRNSFLDELGGDTPVNVFIEYIVVRSGIGLSKKQISSELQIKGLESIISSFVKEGVLLLKKDTYYLNQHNLHAKKMIELYQKIAFREMGVSKK